jgi:hypothetical protein
MSVCVNIGSFLLRTKRWYTNVKKIRCIEGNIVGRSKENIASIQKSVKKGKVKVKIIPWHDYAGTVGWRWYSSDPFVTSAPEAGGWWAPLFGRFSRENPVLVVGDWVRLFVGVYGDRKSDPNRDSISGLDIPTSSQSKKAFVLKYVNQSCFCKFITMKYVRTCK